MPTVDTGYGVELKLTSISLQVELVELRPQALLHCQLSLHRLGDDARLRTYTGEGVRLETCDVELGRQSDQRAACLSALSWMERVQACRGELREPPLTTASQERE